MKRGLYNEDHEAFRGVVREFVRREVEPRLTEWEDDQSIGREVWTAAGAQGLLGLCAPAEHGGPEHPDYRFRNVVQEELALVFASSLSASFSIQDDIVIPYLGNLASDAQKARWLPSLVSGEVIGAIAMTEPGTGSDLRGIRTSAAKVDGGWLLNGSKTFITNGLQSDLVIVVARTDPDGGARGFTLFVAERGMVGFSRGRKLAKLGLHAQDTSELFFEDVFIPDENVLGEVGGGFGQLVSHLALERLSIAAHGIAVADAVFAVTVDYVTERSAFGQAVADFQNTRFELADMAATLDATRALVDKAVLAYGEGELTPVDAAKAKLYASERQGEIIDRCLQLHGGYGFMTEYPVARAYQDARVQRIFGGTSEIMKHIIGRDVVQRSARPVSV